MLDHPEFARTLERRYLYAFLGRSFDLLHPGQRLIRAPYIDAMCYALQRVAEGHERRLLITVPPRHLKSICTAVAFTAWCLGRDPTFKLLVASYGSDLAAKHARDFRTIIESPWYRQLFPATQIHPRRNTELETMMTMRGGRKAVTLGGPTTGFGADGIIIDDLMKAADAQSETERARARDYFEQTLYSRLDKKQQGWIVAIQQRLHEDDLAGYLLHKQNFRHLNLRAIAEEAECFPLLFGRSFHRLKGDALFPQRETLADLENIRREIGSAVFSAQYQQNPVPLEGNRIRWDWFGTYPAPLPREHFQQVVQSWDTAVTAEPTSDFSVCTTWGIREGKWHLLDVLRARLEYPDLKRTVIRERRRWRPDMVLIEHANSGVPLLQELRKEGFGPLLGPRPTLPKEIRVAAQTAKLEAGLVLVPEQAAWLETFRSELRAFPNGRYDDQVDSMIQFLGWIGARRGQGWLERQENGGRPRGRARRSPSTRRPMDPWEELQSDPS